MAGSLHGVFDKAIRFLQKPDRQQQFIFRLAAERLPEAVSLSHLVSAPLRAPPSSIRKGAVARHATAAI